MIYIYDIVKLQRYGGYFMKKKSSIIVMNKWTYLWLLTIPAGIMKMVYDYSVCEDMVTFLSESFVSLLVILIGIVMFIKFNTYSNWSNPKHPKS